MKKESIQSLLDPLRVNAIDSRAKSRGLSDVWATAAARAKSEVGEKGAHAEVALAAIRVQQIVGLIPSRADQENFEAGLRGENPKPFKTEKPARSTPEVAAAVPEPTSKSQPAAVANAK